MDIQVLVYYAAICAVLSWAAPSLRGAGVRLIVGAVVGVAAAAALPTFMGLIGS